MKLSTKNAVITGASRGLGRTIARTFWHHGANLLLIARSADALKSLRAELEAAPVSNGQTVRTLCADLSERDAAKKILDAVHAQTSKVDVLINNAGILGPVGKAWLNDWQHWEETVRINLLVPVELCRAFVPGMIAAGGGSIINLSGGGATGPRPNFTAYATAKTGLVRFTEILAAELSGTGVRANSIAPGALATDMLTELVAQGRDAVGAEEFDKVMKLMQTGGTPPERAADLCAFLASDESKRISGKLLSAPWDPWENLGGRMDALQNSDIYTLRRIVPEDRGQKWS